MAFRLKEPLGKMFEEEVQFFKTWWDKTGVGHPDIDSCRTPDGDVVNPQSRLPVLALGAEMQSLKRRKRAPTGFSQNTQGISITVSRSAFRR